MIRSALLALAAVAGCSPSGGSEIDTRSARAFTAYPLYWVGERFERWDLAHVDVGRSQFVSLTYGTCDVGDPDGPLGLEGGSCSPPLQLQLQPLCRHLEAVARARVWRRRAIRGAPVGTIDSAPVLFASRVQIKVYRGEGTDPGLPLRALRALRSLNEVEPVLGPDDRIPGAPRAVLAGERPCPG
jgi:hypothetical protein